MDWLQAPVLILLTPLFAAFAVSVIGLIKPRFAMPLFLAGLVGYTVFAVSLLFQVMDRGAMVYEMGGWPPPIGIVFVVDQINVLVTLVIAVVALATGIHSIPIVKRDLKERSAVFYSLYLLLVVGLTGMTLTGDLFNMYVMIEVTAICTYALVALAGGRAYLSAFQYIIIGTIGACFYLLGVGFLYIKTGTLNMADLKALLPALYDSPSIMLGFGLILVGLFIKMAFFPFHGWIANAYTHAPGPVTCLVGPLATKVAVYAMIRIMFWVFDAHFDFEILHWNQVLVWMAVIAIFAGGFFALAQVEVKRMVVFIVVAEVGYMVGGVWLGNRTGLAGATFHILNDAMATLCLFLVVATVRHMEGGSWSVESRHRLTRMPYTTAALVLGGLTMIGVPPTSGFFSKWYLVSGGMEAGQWHFVAALLFASIVNIVLFLRIIEFVYIPERDKGHGYDHHPVPMEEAPLVMMIPLMCVAVSLVALGLGSNAIIKNLILPVLPL